MFYFLPPKYANVILFQNQSVEEKRKSVSTKGLTTPPPQRSFSFSGGNPPNMAKSSQVRYGVLPISFTPPASFEDILDDGYETMSNKPKNNGIGEKVLAAKKVQSTGLLFFFIIIF